MGPHLLDETIAALDKAVTDLRAAPSRPNGAAVVLVIANDLALLHEYLTDERRRAGIRLVTDDLADVPRGSIYETGAHFGQDTEPEHP